MRDHFPFAYLFLAGLIAGIFIMNLGRSIMPEATGLLDEDTLYHLKDMTVDGSALFAFVLRKRLGTVIVTAILATTYLGLAVCILVAFWYGLTAGAFLAAAVLRYGIRGIFLVAACTLPQYLCYLPALYALLLWCEDLYRSIYLKNRYPSQKETPAVLKRVFRLLLIMAVLLAGCMLESFAGPAILKSWLNVFYSYSARS